MAKKNFKRGKSRVKSADKAPTWIFYLNVYIALVLMSLLSYGITTFTLQAINKTPTCANSKSCQSDLAEKIENGAIGTFEGRTVVAPHIDTNADIAKLPVLGATTSNGEKHIYVDLEKQTLYAMEGNKEVFKTLIASGKWNRTPVGNFHIWEKLRSTRMAGGEGADAYDLPNVPYVMYFYNDFGLHGAYWHDNYGHQMSHGCVNMRPIDAKFIFDWSDGPTADQKGTAVSICDKITEDHQCIQTNPINN
jgi:hypothetical protein